MFDDERLAEIFTQYREILKPLLAEIEALDQQFPAAVLNEIRACFDHISRCYGTSPDIAKNIDRAKGHISRAILYCCKTLVVLFHDRIVAFQRQNNNKDWSTVDGGRFNSKFCELRCFAKRRYIEAKRQQDTEQNWLEVYRAYRAVNDFLKKPENVLLVHEGKNKETWRSKLLWCVVSAVVGMVIGSTVTVYNKMKMPEKKCAEEIKQGVPDQPNSPLGLITNQSD